MIRKMVKMERPMLKNKSKYCYDNGVLINKKNIKEANVLDAFSRDVTTFRISQLTYNNTVINNFFKLEDYLKLHYFLFQDIFYFAGEIRDETIYKSNEPYFTGDNNKTSIFATPNSIVPQLEYNLSMMGKRVRNIKSRDDLLEYLSYFYGELNVIHPFREGNGRTLRTYLKLLVEHLNKYFSAEIGEFELDYSLWSVEDREELLKSTIICNVTCNHNYIKNCFDKVLVEKKTKNKNR